MDVSPEVGWTFEFTPNVAALDEAIALYRQSHFPRWFRIMGASSFSP